MEIMLNNGLLGEFDYHGDTIKLPDLEKPKTKKIVGKILAGLGALFAGIIGLSLLLAIGNCLGCKSCGCSSCGGCSACSSCLACDGCSSCSGCGNKMKVQTYHIVYEDGSTNDLKYEEVKSGCSVVREGFTNFGSISRDSRFFSEEGYYKKSSFKDKDLVIDSNGNIVGKIKDGATYYSKSHELYVGEERRINLTFKDGSIYPIIATVGEKIIGLPNIPTLEGYEFTGGYCGLYQVISSTGTWTNSKFHLYDYGTTDQTLTVELKYTEKQYTASVHINSKTFSLTIANGSLLKDVIASAQKYVTSNLQSNQAFVGWSFTNKEDELITESTMNTQKITGTIQLYAIIKSKIQITLNDKNGSVTQKDVVQGAVTSLDAPNPKQGYHFIGWCKNADLSDEPFNEIKVDTAGIILYAKWDPNEYKITYLSSIDDHILGDKKYTYSENSTIPLMEYNETWTPNGYEFAGWGTSKDATKYITELPKGTYDDIKVYAIYSAKKFNVTLDEGYGLPLSNNRVPIEYGSSFTLPIISIDDPSKEFIGFYYNDIQVTDKTGNSLLTYDESSLRTTYIKLESITFTAKFDTKKITIKFYNDNATTLLYTEKVDYSEKIPSHSAPSKPGYTFDGWSMNKDNYVEYDFDSSVTEAFDLYASYSPITYTVTLEIKSSDASFGTLETTTVDVVYDDSFIIPTPDLNEAYDFVGYYLEGVKVTDSIGGSINVFNANNLNVTISQIEDGLTFTAEFAIKTFTVKYYYNSDLFDAKIVDYGESATNKVLTDIPTGYEFKGWTTNLNTKELYDFEQSVIMADLDLYAIVTPMEFTINLFVSSAYGLLNETTVVVKYDSIYELPVPSLNEGYEFVGYYYGSTKVTDETGNSFKAFNVSSLGGVNISYLESGISLTAICKEIVYTVSYYCNGELMQQRKVTYGDKAEEIAGPTSLEQGYRFIGWSTLEKSYEAYDFTNDLTDDLVLYAYLSNKYKVTLYDSDKTTILHEFEVTYGSTNWSIPYTPSLSSSQWLGWFLVDGDIKIADKNGNTVSPYTTFDFTEDIEIYIKG